MQQQDRLPGRLRLLARPFVDVMHAQPGAGSVASIDFDVVRCERIVRQILETRLGCAQDLHALERCRPRSVQTHFLASFSLYSDIVAFRS